MKQFGIYIGTGILLGIVIVGGFFAVRYYQHHQKYLIEIKAGDAFYRARKYELALQTYKNAKNILPKSGVVERIYQTEETLVSVQKQESQQIIAELSTTPRDNIQALHASFNFDDIPEIEDEFVAYYYRRPYSTQIIPMLERSLSEGILLHDVTLKEIMSHFWAALIHQMPKELEQIKNLLSKYSGEQLAHLQDIIHAAEHFQPALAVSPESLHLIWAEFMTTGNMTCFDQILAVLKLPETLENTLLVTTAAHYVLEKSPRYVDIYERLVEQTGLADGLQKERLEKLYNKLDSTIMAPTQQFFMRGHNYYRQKQYSEALQEYKNAITLYPDYAAAYEGAAIVYQIMDEREKAFHFYKKALWINPYDQRTYYNLGNLYRDMFDYTSAIVMYKKAVEISPTYPTFLYWLASAYEKNYDTANAIIYFQEYLKYAPDNKKVDTVKQYLASLNIEIKERPESVTALLRQKQYTRLEQHMENLLQEKKRNENGQLLLDIAYEEFIADDIMYDKLETRLQYFTDWVKQHPSSHFANAVIGKFYVFYAWKARGPGTAGTITHKGGLLFEERLQLAKTYLEKAYSLEPNDPFVSSSLINVALGLGLGREEMERQFQRALQADPDAYDAYVSKLAYLQPQWYGSKQEMFTFTRDAVQKSSSISRIPLLLATAHWNMQNLSNNPGAYFRDPEVWKEVKWAYDTLHSRFPDAQEYHNKFALAAYLAGDYSTAKQEFEKIGNNWYTGVWHDYRSFSKIKAEVMSH